MATGYTNLNCKLPAAREPCEGHDGLGRDTRVCVSVCGEGLEFG